MASVPHRGPFLTARPVRLHKEDLDGVLSNLNGGGMVLLAYPGLRPEASQNAVFGARDIDVT
jgi:hypothetical protein